MGLHVPEDLSSHDLGALNGILDTRGRLTDELHNLVISEKNAIIRMLSDTDLGDLIVIPTVPPKYSYGIPFSQEVRLMLKTVQAPFMLYRPEALISETISPEAMIKLIS
jgi:hypothetical protein